MLGSVRVVGIDLCETPDHYERGEIWQQVEPCRVNEGMEGSVRVDSETGTCPENEVDQRHGTTRSEKRTTTRHRCL